ncbi:dynactin subunit 1-like isoform X2 [Acanthaster planci]|uniref:Dynactin subunit 1 n=1 Tax=Acanthaster planci TaxID=133434 RepID=A0A8B7XIW7_ACAPL|nr:dynactin subunit 1-like isoform X2 [Acanthaster planci]
MAEKPVKTGSKVEIIGKGLHGKVAFVGVTAFASGKWIGVVLDEPKGKNNGIVQGKKYFSCPDNHGIFVRQSQITVEESPPGSGTASPGTASPAPTGIPKADKLSPSGKKQPASTSIKSSESPAEKSLSVRRIAKYSPARRSTEGLSRSRVESPITDAPSTPSSRLPQPPTAGRPAISGGDAQSSEQVGSLKLEVQDLKEKLETLRIKRAEDKMKLKEAEKMKIQLAQLAEFKAKMIEAKNDLERQLQEAKKEAREATEARERYQEEMSEVAETIEMATLDKEMAEEKCDSLQAEVDTLKEKVEELTLDLELLRGEIEQGGTDGASANYQLKQMEQQNARLKEALVKLRDLSNAEKHEHQKALKDKDKIVAELKETKAQKESANKALKDAENQIIELKEQVDAALGAEGMVETLTDRNLELEEQLQDLQTTVADLESLNEMNEELQENARETELELREEADMQRSKVAEYQRRIEAMKEAASDSQETIAKFRQLTASLQEKNRDLISQQQSAAVSQDAAADMPTFDFKAKFLETKVQAKAVEVDLYKLRIDQANQHIDYLCSFMPDQFLRRGGDHDCVQVLLLISRMLAKSDLLVNQLKERAEIPETMNREEVLRNNKGEQLAFTNFLIFTMSQLQAILTKYQIALTNCNVALLCKIGTLYPEMSPHETALDYLIDLFRKDQLDETTSLESLMKAIGFFTHLYNVHLSQENVDQTLLMADSVRLVSSATDIVGLEIKKLRVLMQAMQETSDFSILLKDLEGTNADLKTFARMIRRRLPQVEGSDGPTPGPQALVYGGDVQSSLTECCEHLITLVAGLRDLGQGAMKVAGSLADASDKEKRKKQGDAEGIPVARLEEIAERASDLAYGKQDKGPYQSFRESLVRAMVIMSKISQAVQEGEYDSNVPMDKIQPPIARRAIKVKSEICDSEGLGHKLELKDSEIKDLKRQLKLKQEEVSANAVRLGLVEKKLENASRDGEDKVGKVERELAQQHDLLKKKEREFEDTLDHMQSDIDALEREKLELKQRLTQVSKKALFESLTSKTAPSGIAAVVAGAAGGNQGGTSPTSPTGGGVPLGSQVVIKDSPMLVQQIESLKHALCKVKGENVRLKSAEMKRIMDTLPPLHVPKKPTGLASPTGFVALVPSTEEPSEAAPADGGTAAAPKPPVASVDAQMDVTLLARRTRKLLQELHHLSASPKVVDITQRKPGMVPAIDKAMPIHQLVDRMANMQQLKTSIAQLQNEMQALLSSQRPGAQAKTDFSVFPSADFSKVQTEKTGAPRVGKLSIPVSGDQQPCSYSVSLQQSQLRRVHAQLMA